MYICAAGDIHGAMNKLYDEVLDFEVSLGIRFNFEATRDDILRAMKWSV